MNKVRTEGFGIGTIVQYFSYTWRHARIIGIGPRRLLLVWRQKNGVVIKKAASPRDVRLYRNDLDTIVRDRTAFRSFDELLNAPGDYRPTIISRDAIDLALVTAYNDAQMVRSDPRRAYVGR